ncbi:LANO_0H18580g1_1 [Lachancea nothofagi CBS 11611]|uniref:LANO_0H18580g1_1 n=1 Tax=Lachancea nothofagi CBS 11611 TaxID=1266666 RepID=A0A1G4KN90_9SACH|nr:LANO_0H18580g1_1 [Lachancea nothofagi CBS 11611]
MDKAIVKGLNDKLYEKRKATALNLEKLVKQCLAEGNYERVDQILDELCRDFAYALHQPMARNAGLMGLAAGAIALGSTEVGRYLDRILPPVLACFGDQNDQVRFYACESLYNIAKIAKGEILVYFNEIFDVLCKISADTETSVRGAAELLDRLIKDIVAERASNYISIVNNDPKDLPPSTRTDPQTGEVLQEEYNQEPEYAFSLPKFIPLLTERIYAINPDTRMFLVSWLQVLENIPDLELISYLPSFLGGLFTFLGDSHKDVRTVTHSLLDLLLHEAQHISEVKALAKKKLMDKAQKRLVSEETSAKKQDGLLISERKKSLLTAFEQLAMIDPSSPIKSRVSSNGDESKTNEATAAVEENSGVSTTDILESLDSRNGDLYCPGQDIHLDYPKIIEILINTLGSSEPEIQLVALTWIETVLDICPLAFLPFLSRLLSLLLKILNDVDHRVRKLAQTVNGKLIDLTGKLDYKDEPEAINYGPIVNTLTLHFLDSDVVAKVACLDWLILIYQKVPNQLLEHSDSTFLTLLKSLSDKDNQLVSKALHLLSDLCNNSNEEYFKKFIRDLLLLFKNDGKLLKTRANHIFRQLGIKLSSEKVYNVVSSILEGEEDILFVRMMIQILNTNLITAPELEGLRRKLKAGTDNEFFSCLFKCWSHNPTSLLALCLLAGKYELAYYILQTFVEYEITVNDLVQIDILVQLLESPVFTSLRLQLLEQERYPYLYKCLYGILMVLPQSKAFQILNTRLSSVSTLAARKVPPSPFYKVNDSSSNLSEALSSESLNSPNSFHQKRTRFQGLLDHFRNVCEVELSSPKSTCVEEVHFALLDHVLTPEPVFGNTSQSRDRSEDDNNDTESVIYRG